MVLTIIDTGLTEAFLGTKAAVPAMRRVGGGSILYQEISAALLSRLVTLTRHLFGTTVPTDPMTVQSASIILRIADGAWATPLGRLMTPEGITKTFLFVASEGGSMVTVNSGAAL